MKVNYAHKIRLFPTEGQTTYFAKACGISRLTFNWGLTEWKKQHKSGEKPSKFKLKKEFNSIKRKDFPFITEVTKCAPERAFDNLGSAFTNFFRRVKKGEKPGFPKYKKKGKSDSFYLSNDKFSVINKTIKVPKLGKVRMAEKLRFGGKILSATISRRGSYWYASINVETELVSQVNNSTSDNQVVGVDLGISTMATLSDGVTFESPRPYKKLQHKLVKAQRHLSRKVKGSNNRYKQKIKLGNIHHTIFNIRQDSLHKLTSYLVKNYDVISIEDLNVKGMLKNRKLSKAISNMGFFEFKRQLLYKANYKGKRIHIVDRYFPSTKLCSFCGNKQDMPLEKRIYKCSNCTVEIDRDLNAAINMELAVT